MHAYLHTCTLILPYPTHGKYTTIPWVDLPSLSHPTTSRHILFYLNQVTATNIRRSNLYWLLGKESLPNIVCKYCIIYWYKLFNCEVLIDILCLDCGFLKVRVNLFFTSWYEGVNLKAESSDKNWIGMPGGQVKPNLICLIGKKGKQPKNDIETRDSYLNITCVGYTPDW